MRRALRRAATSRKLLILALLAFAAGGGVVGTTVASFTAETRSLTSTVAGGWVDAPTGLAATVSGYDVSLSWTHGTHDLTGQALWGVTHGTTNNCTSVTYAQLATMASATTNTYTDANRGDGSHAAANGDWFCYEMFSTHDSWRTGQTISALQVGMATTTLGITAGGTASRIDGGDVITLTFNQRAATYGGTTKVCAVTGSNTVYIGDGATTCGTSDTALIGTLTGKTIAATRTFATSTINVTTGTPFRMTVTLPAGTGGTATVSGAGSWKFVPSGSASGVKSFATTDQALLCSSATTTCQPTTANNF